MPQVARPSAAAGPAFVLGPIKAKVFVGISNPNPAFQLVRDGLS